MTNKTIPPTTDPAMMHAVDADLFLSSCWAGVNLFHSATAAAASAAFWFLHSVPHTAGMMKWQVEVSLFV